VVWLSIRQPCDTEALTQAGPAHPIAQPTNARSFAQPLGCTQSTERPQVVSQQPGPDQATDSHTQQTGRAHVYAAEAVIHSTKGDFHPAESKRAKSHSAQPSQFKALHAARPR